MTPEQVLKLPGVAGCADLAIDLVKENERLRAALQTITEPLLLETPGSVGVEKALKIIITMQAIAKDALAASK
jgi:hypothetical protein